MNEAPSVDEEETLERAPIVVHELNAPEARTRRGSSDHRDAVSDARDAAADARDSSASTRERALLTRDAAMAAREVAIAAREAVLAAREQLVTIREQDVRTRIELEDDRMAGELLFDQLRSANQHLVLATLHADELVELSAATQHVVEQFIGILSHDLRSPLSAITLGAEMFRNLPEPYTRVTAQMLRSVSRMDVLIRDMMDFTRGRLGGGIPVTMVPCNLGTLAHEVIQEMQQAHPTRDLRCETSGDLNGSCDNDRAEQVFSNLLGNAITHGADPIRLTVLDEGDDIVIRVCNHGRVIPAALIPQLFEPFARGTRLTGVRGFTQGLGLGLYIVHSIVTAHGGTIEVTSSEAAGTEVAIRWPRGTCGPTTS